ncbi:MAG: 4Fe-4S binding protein, partial [Gammaproteobacteria bacterium]|nr:4Fe-4S binding protein [Gammaproteobacteria bacterium]
LGASNVQVCTAAMVYGFKIIDDLVDGLSNFLDYKGMSSVSDLVGRALPSVTDWQYLNLNHVEKAHIDQDLCIKCGRCHIACEDTAHQAITTTVNGERHFEVIDAECVGCNLCVSVCPVENCISMRPMTGGTDPRTGQPITAEKADWTTHPNNPMRKDA